MITVIVNHVPMPGEEDDEHEVDSDRSYSVEEFAEIRRATRADRRRGDAQ